MDEQRGPEAQARPLQPGNEVAARHRFRHLYKPQAVGELSWSDLKWSEVGRSGWPGQAA